VGLLLTPGSCSVTPEPPLWSRLSACGRLSIGQAACQIGVTICSIGPGREADADS